MRINAFTVSGYACLAFLAPFGSAVPSPSTNACAVHQNSGTCLELRGHDWPQDDSISALQTFMVSPTSKGAGVPLRTELTIENQSHNDVQLLAEGGVGNESFVPNSAGHLAGNGIVSTMSWITGILVAQICAIVVVHELCLYCDILGDQRWQPEDRVFLIVFDLFWAITWNADRSFLIPGALNLSKEMGSTVVMSGTLDCLDLPGMILGSLVAAALNQLVPHHQQRKILIFFLSLNALLEVILGFCMMTPSLETPVLTAIFVVFRVFSGFTAGLGSLGFMMCCSTCSPSELALFATLFASVGYFGNVLGPLISSVAMSLVPANMNFLHAQAVPLLFIAMMQSISSLGATFAVPVNLSQVAYSSEDLAVEATQNLGGPSDPDFSFIPDSRRQLIAIQGMSTLCLGSLLCQGIIQSLPVFLEVEGKWSIANIGVATAIVTFLTGAVLIFFNGLRKAWGVNLDNMLVMNATIAGALGILLLFTLNLGGLDPQLQLIVAASISSACFTTIQSVVAGYAMAIASDGTWYSSQVLSTSFMLIGQLSLFAAGPIGRALAIGLGQNSFAAFSAIVASGVVLNFIYVRAYLMYQEEKTPDAGLMSESSQEDKKFIHSSPKSPLHFR